MSAEASTSGAAVNGKKKKAPKRVFDLTSQNRRHVALRVSYIGWDMHGLARQENIPNTVEEHLFNALQRTNLSFGPDRSRYSRCGRTDKGVSALSQVVALYVRTLLPSGASVIPAGVDLADDAQNTVENLERLSQQLMQEKPLPEGAEEPAELDYPTILNGVLPPEIRVHAWCPVPHNFSARFSCVGRTYRYYFLKQTLDVDAMNRAAQRLLGEHDFRNFCKMDIENVKSFRRSIHSACVRPCAGAAVALKQDPQSPLALYEFEVVGSAFLWHQVRCMVAVLFLVGQGHEDESVITSMFDLPCKPVFLMAPPEPLVLYNCSFGDIPLDWRTSEGHTARVLQTMMSIYSQVALKAAVVIGMMCTLPEFEPMCNDMSIMHGVGKRTRHIPLLERPVEASYEERRGFFERKLRRKNDGSAVAGGTSRDEEDDSEVPPPADDADE
nr:tRNA pseudouridine(38/39) synthase [Seculamonas ecuadoriensis]